MTLERDAAFLAGFIVGTYDLRGDAAPPVYIQPFLDRILKSSAVPKVEGIIQGLTPPTRNFSEEAKATAKKIVSIVNGMSPHEPASGPEEPKVIVEQPERNTSADAEGEDRIELVRRLAGMGWSDKGIAEKLGLSHGGVFQVRKRHGIPSGREQKANGVATVA
jgi:hypothetical protein